MSKLKSHPFFRSLELAEQLQKKFGIWSFSQIAPKSKGVFYKALKEAHPFVFDDKVTREKRVEGRAHLDLETFVEEFSLPFKTSLYLLSDAPAIVAPTFGKPGHRTINYVYGYLIVEKTPEKFDCYKVGSYSISAAASQMKEPSVVRRDDKNYVDIHWEEVGHNLDTKEPYPVIEHWVISLEELKQMNFGDIPNDSLEMHQLKETSTAMVFTQSISVKRIGIENVKGFNVKSRGAGLGVTSIKYDNLYHVADKVEYEYTTGFDAAVNFEHSGFWRGHWRAFYCHDSTGSKITDSFGRNVVDYNRTGKSRTGEYVVPGYTWVSEHTKGDPKVAEVKTHFVKRG